VSVTLNTLPLHVLELGLGLGDTVAPLGTLVKSMSWMLVV
jgi:hypothetical protein